LLPASGNDGQTSLKDLMHSMLVPRDYPLAFENDDARRAWLKYAAVRRCLTCVNADGCYKSGRGKSNCVASLNEDKAFKQGTVSHGRN
jgi:hypothetical protein